LGEDSVSVKYGILAVLDRHSMHGYDLRRELETELGPEWTVNYGQVYSTLERLVRDELVVQSETVSSSDAPDRKLYTVTPAGRADLRRWFLTPVASGATGRDELYAKVVLGLSSDVDVEQIVQAQRKEELRRIASLTKLKDGLDTDLDLPAVLDLDLAILKTESIIKWLDTAEARIRKAASSDGVALRRGPGGLGDEGSAASQASEVGTVKRSGKR
jgi:DNA-binding PadR family transcriptional regulator